MTNRALLLSIKPEYATKIFEGKKTIELRRTKPNVKKGDLAIVYVSSPIKAIKGAFEIDDIISATPSELWKKVKTKSGVTESEYYTYFQGAQVAFGIALKKVWTFGNQLPLEEIREWLSINPPQSFRYLTEDQVEIVGKRIEESNLIEAFTSFP